MRHQRVDVLRTQRLQQRSMQSRIGVSLRAGIVVACITRSWRERLSG
jgi:hypothetical protein